MIDKPETVELFWGARVSRWPRARLTHPNIVAAFDAEQAGDVHFLAMEFVEGVSLAHRCAEHGPLPVAEACSYTRQAALGLQHAHECGMVHRDIKPQNLMLTPGGQVKTPRPSWPGQCASIMEQPHQAGALLPAVGVSSSDSIQTNALTQIGVVVGTPDYIAPEQAQDSHQADIRADIYSLGCTLYDMLAGHAPFPEGNAVQKVKAHLHRTPPPLKTLRRDVPRELVRVVERMMAKDPAQRYQTPADVALALAPFTTAKPPRSKKWPLVAAFSFFAALALGVVIYVQTDHGTIVIETNDESVAVLIEKAGGVKIVDKANKREYTLKPGAQNAKPGEYKLDVTEPMAGLEFSTTEFELKRGAEVRVTAKLVPAALGKVEPPTRTKFSPIDFQTLANHKLKAPLGSGTDGNTLASLSPGEHRFLGIPFQIGQGLLQVGSTKLQNKPAKIAEIRVDRKLSSLHFLQGTNWSYDKEVPVSSYVVHYADGSSATIPIVYGKDTASWWKYANNNTPSAAKVAWTGTNPAASRFRATLWLLMSTWKNPKPDIRVTSIEFTSTMDTPSAPFCVAITTEGPEE